MKKIVKNRKHILLSIDVEDWFQVENFKKWIPFSTWTSYELRVEENTHQLLDLLDSISINTSRSIEQITPKATFFILAWIAKRLPQLIREIKDRGHEVASHGCHHNLCNKQFVEELVEDLKDSKKILEDIIGSPVFGYRAPSFSINEDIFPLLQDCGYLYDSSYNSFNMNSRYGKVNLPQEKKEGIRVEVLNNFYELPISNYKIGNHVLPLGGGGYFRLIPFDIFKIGVKSILNRDKVYLFYLHSWEIDPGQPRMKQASSLFKFRHYVNLNNTYSKIYKLIKSFDHYNFITCYQYLTLERDKAEIENNNK